MAINRQLFNTPLKESLSSLWRCPICSKGHFAPIKNSLTVWETSTSVKDQAHDDWQPDWYRGTFFAQLQCSNPDCNEQAVVSGIAKGDYDVRENGEVGPDVFYEPKFILPAPPLFEIPYRCPAKVKDRIAEAFSLYWSDSSACVGRVRAAIELLMDELKVKRKSVNKKGEMVRLNLDGRIRELSKKGKKYKDFEDHLLAAKWLGNTGAHTFTVSRDDALDAFDILEFLLEELFNDRTRHIARITKEVNKNKGPRKKKKLKEDWGDFFLEGT